MRLNHAVRVQEIQMFDLNPSIDLKYETWNIWNMQVASLHGCLLC